MSSRRRNTAARQEPNAGCSGDFRNSSSSVARRHGSTIPYTHSCCTKYAYNGYGVRMPIATQAEELVVWTQPKTLAERNLSLRLLAQVSNCTLQRQSRSGEAWVSSLSFQSQQDSAVESTLATLRSCKVSNCWFTRLIFADFAFRVGTMVGRQRFTSSAGIQLAAPKTTLKARTSGPTPAQHRRGNFLRRPRCQAKAGLSQEQLGML